jgi:hypothetical protein
VQKHVDARAHAARQARHSPCHVQVAAGTVWRNRFSMPDGRGCHVRVRATTCGACVCVCVCVCVRVTTTCVAGVGVLRGSATLCARADATARFVCGYGQRVASPKQATHMRTPDLAPYAL